MYILSMNMDDKNLTPTQRRRRAQMRALAEHIPPIQKTLPCEHGGCDGPEPTRYGDWERSGIARDF